MSMTCLWTVAYGAAFAVCLPWAATAQDLERGKEVFRDVGNCVNCHGWDGAGRGKNPRAPSGANLRESSLDAQSLDQIIQCGIPGTEMPYHDQNAYRDDRCYGMTFEDFEPGQAPKEGDIFREADREDLVAYLQEYVVGQGETTFEDCQRFFSEDSPRCAPLKE